MEYVPHASAHPVPFCVAIVLAVGFFALGIFRLWVMEPRARWLVAVLIFPGLLTYAYAVLRHKMLEEQYVGFMLQGVAVMVAAGAFWAFSPLRKFPAARWAGTLLAVVLVCAFAVLSNPARQFLLNWGAERYRESVPKSGSQCARKPENHRRSDHAATLRLRSESAPGTRR
jgi:hypothetical protein